MAQDVAGKTLIEIHNDIVRYCERFLFLPMLQVNISFPSGFGENLQLPERSNVGDLKILAQKSLRQGFLKLITAEGHVLTNPEISLQAAGVQEGEHLTVVAQQTKVAHTQARHLRCGAQEATRWLLGAIQKVVVTAP